ncbi:unnamed protein product [Arabis nemorensis]|uniref:Major facilitator superfamily (MFS) profile domain-containing protein n=1 Tax=Arabis nemorensis TaxID=586526 RepID=A0A565BU06_9BRAS|nr:unnamed protein product [Arabis nemorensis]
MLLGFSSHAGGYLVAHGRANRNGHEYPQNDDGIDDQEMKSKESLLRNCPLMAIIIVYCVFSLQEIAYSEIFSLWAVSDRSYGGLSFSSQDVGQVLAISVCHCPSISPLDVSRDLSCHVFRTWAFGLSTFRIPAVGKGPGTPCGCTSFCGVTLHLVINCASILKNALSVSNPGGRSFVLTTSPQVLKYVSGIFAAISVFGIRPQSQRGAANGISMTAMSIFMSFGPAGGGALFSLAQKRQVATFLPGDEMVFLVLNLVQLVGLILTFIPYISRIQ